MGVWRYTTKIVNGICQKVYKFYEVYGPPEHVVSVGLACVKAGALAAAVGVPAYVGVRAVQRAMQPPVDETPAGESYAQPFNAGGFQGFGYMGGRRDDGGSVVYPGVDAGGFSGFGGGGGYRAPSILDSGGGFDLLLPAGRYRGPLYRTPLTTAGDDGSTGSGLVPLVPGAAPPGDTSMSPNAPGDDTNGGSDFQIPPVTTTPGGDTVAAPEPPAVVIFLGGLVVLFLFLAAER